VQRSPQRRVDVQPAPAHWLVPFPPGIEIADGGELRGFPDEGILSILFRQFRKRKTESNLIYDFCGVKWIATAFPSGDGRGNQDLASLILERQKSNVPDFLFLITP
jgi:hypothetical protein